jgi:hypothetical protein
MNFILVGTPETGPFLRLIAAVPLNSVALLLCVDILVKAKFVSECLCNPDPFTITISNVASKTGVVVAEAFVCFGVLAMLNRFDLQ